MITSRRMTVVALATLLATVAPAQAASPDSIDVARLKQRLREAHLARIGIDHHTFELINPRVGADGIAYERIPGLPKRRPALVAGADWDTVAMPSNPIPWSRIERIETGYPVGTHAVRNGAFLGLLVGAVTAVVVLETDHDPYSYAPLGAILFLVWSPFLGAFVGSAFHTTRWEQVYPGSIPEKH